MYIHHTCVSAEKLEIDIGGICVAHNTINKQELVVGQAQAAALHLGTKKNLGILIVRYKMPFTPTSFA